MSFEQYQQKYILGPLGMNDSAWQLTDTIRKRLANAIMRYNRGDGTFAFCEAPVFDLGTTPAGSLVTTVSDLAKFAAFLMSESPTQSQLAPLLVKPETLNEMFKVQLTGAAEGFGLGFINRLYRGYKVARHGGLLYGFTSLLSVMHEKKLGFIILTNADEIAGPTRNLTDAAFDLMLEAVHGEPRPAPIQPLKMSRDELSKFAGQYESQSYWASLEVITENNESKLTANYSTQSIELTPVEPLKFLATGRVMDRDPIQFECDSTVNVIGFKVFEQQFRRIDPSKILQPPIAWQKFVGSYGPEYIPLVISIRNGSLYACAENEHDYKLKPLNRVTFQLPPGMYTDEQLVFQIDAAGNPYAVILAGMYLARNK